MHCSKCNRYLGIIKKFCPKCGTVVTPEQKKKGLITFGIWVLLFVLLTPIIYFLVEKYDPYVQDVQKYSHFKVFLISAFFSLIAVEIFAFFYWIFVSIVRFVRRQPILGSIIIGAVVVLAGFAGYVYLTDLNEQKFSASLTLLQDNLTEATVAKIMGDSLVENKKLITASWERVDIEAQMVLGRLKELKVSKELGSYQIAAIIWTEKIAAGVKDHNLWNDVGDDPGVFKLALSDSQAQKLFEASNVKIAELKEFGDTAIKSKNDVSMLYIGAKIIVQRHWLNGISHSEKSWSLSYNLITPALALTFGEGVPPVGPSGDVTCRVCNDPSVHWTPTLRKQYNCDIRCKSSGTQQQNNQQQNQQQQNQQNNQQQNNNGGQNQNSQNQNNINQQNQNQANQNNTGNNTSNNGVSGWQGTDSNTVDLRHVCIGRGGVSTGNSPTNVYCVDDVVQLTNGIDASAIGFAQGNPNAKNGWDNGWHNLEGTGVISSGGSTQSASGHTPTVQKFYDDCTAHGGTVGNSSVGKSRLPTTEFGYTCGYKNKDSKDCWDYLTYSGGRYMGGSPGCEEKNLLSNNAEEQAKAGKGGKWDGHYTGTISLNCRTTLPDKPTASQSFPMDFPVVNNVTLDTANGVNAYVIIDNSGNAIESFQTTIGGANATVNIYAMFYFHFTKQGNKAVFSTQGSMDMTAYREDGTFYGSCVGTGSGGMK